LIAGTLAVALLLGGCDGSDGVDGAPGAPGSSSALVSGTVVNAMTGLPLVGVTIQTDPVVPGVALVTNGSGQYSAELPIGPYVLDCVVPDYEPGTHAISVVADVPVTRNFAMEPVSPVKLTVTSAPAGVGPGDTFPLTVTATPMDGSAVTGVQWVQSNSVPATIANPTSTTATITLGSSAAYKAELLSFLEVLDRWQVQAVNPHALEAAAHVAFTVTVTTTSGSYSDTVEVSAELPFACVNGGLLTVPRGKVVLLNGKEQASYDWQLITPGGAATLQDSTTRNPWFVPDVVGKYTLQVTDLTGAPVMETVDVYSATWIGGIWGENAEGRPTMLCGVCHASTVAEWQETGHAEIFTDNLNTGGHYSASCFPCHTVGYDPAVSNKGFDDANDYAAFMADMFPNGTSHPDPDNYTYMLDEYPAAAQLTNIQCENCHGPNDTVLHQDGNLSRKERISLSADLCGSCHGEPPRHARFQQWEESGHANYELAQDEGMSGGCAKCHTANGFLAWLPILDSGDDGENGSNPPVTWTADEIQPQTCVTCHDPHNVGTTTGEGTNAPMRIQGDTYELMAGFTAYSVGKGAICMQCHNGRRGLRNDQTWSTTTDPDRAPHRGPQSDMVMGQNLYFVNTGFRGPHGFISNTCVNCHLDLTDPPDELSYNHGGTNHTFEASPTICTECHGAFTAENVKEMVVRTSEKLHEAILEAIYLEIERQIGDGNWVDVKGTVSGATTTLTITDIAQVGTIDFTESHGRQAMNIVVGGTLVEGVTMNSNTSVYVAGNDPSTGIGLYETPGGSVIARAGWNLFSAESDSSNGVHNPGFIGGGLEGALNALNNEYK